MRHLLLLALKEAVLRFARELWLYLALAALLTTIMITSAGVTDMAMVSSWFVGNLLLSLSIAASSCLGFALTLRAPYANAWSRSARTVTAVLVFLACVLAGVEFGRACIQVFAPSMAGMFPRTEVLIVALPVSLVMMGFGFLKNQASLARERETQVERKLSEMRLTALSARTDPHFLFNSLNSIVALVEEDPRAAERALIALSAMFRYVLDGSSSHMVKLSDELTFVQHYLGLEQLRFGDRLRVTLEIESGLEAISVPPLLMQPLVENAVRHGIRTRTDPLHIALAARATKHGIELSVDDDGPGPGASQHRGSGTSQADLRLRLQLVYGSGATLETERSGLGGFRALIRLPRAAS